MRTRILSLCLAVSIMSAPQLTSACACGCGVFEVGTGAMLPNGPGGTAWLEYDFMNQDINWHHNHSAPEDDNDDKRVRNHFYTAGVQYMFDRSWGARVEVPYTNRYFRTTDEDTGDLVSTEHSALGDVRLEGIYSGFSPDMSTGVTFGVKLPTGDHSFLGLDRDTDIGSGSTDLLIGGYTMGRLASYSAWGWFADGKLDEPVLIQGQYRPGEEINAAAGIYYEIPLGGSGSISPVLQLIGSQRFRDSGANSDPDNTGYTRILLSPGVEYDLGKLKLYGDVEFPIYQYVRGDQAVAPLYAKFSVGYSF